MCGVNTMLGKSYSGDVGSGGSGQDLPSDPEPSPAATERRAVTH